LFCVDFAVFALWLLLHVTVAFAVAVAGHATGFNATSAIVVVVAVVSMATSTDQRAALAH
jgi:hypothetical protein